MVATRRISVLTTVRTVCQKQAGNLWIRRKLRCVSHHGAVMQWEGMFFAADLGGHSSREWSGSEAVSVSLTHPLLLMAQVG